METRYEEIINHLHKALSSTEEDEQDFKVAIWIRGLVGDVFALIGGDTWPISKPTCCHPDTVVESLHDKEEDFVA